MKHKKLFAIITAALTLIVVLAACGTNDSTPSGTNSTPSTTAGASDGTAETTSESNTTEIKWHITLPGKSGSLCNSPTYIAYEKGCLL